ncbi:glycosyl transferase family protein [Pseudomonas oryzihabitans]|uniref:glycosyl transferase family protein n=1 Tax=Pseudomonas oryzihabitans TaxID=47885 RepID=UPI003B216E77
MTLTTPEEHPFAVYVRALGKGKRGARSLTEAEAEMAMGLILDGQVTEAQLGAFLMLLRHKEESAEELAGFTRAVRARLQPPGFTVDLDWPSYAGKKRHLPWYLLAVKCLAGSGVRVVMHGGGTHTAGRLYTEQCLADLGMPTATDWQDVGALLDRGQPAFLPLAAWMPALQRMIDLKAELGLRSPIHSLVRLLNPSQARCILQSIFHPGYQEVHREASRLLGDDSIVIKGEGGEVERNPDVIAHLYGTRGGEARDESWPALTERRQVKPERLDPALLAATWRGEAEDPYGRLAVIATLAVALRALGQDQASAQREAEQRWEARDRTL